MGIFHAVTDEITSDRTLIERIMHHVAFALWSVGLVCVAHGVYQLAEASTNISLYCYFIMSVHEYIKPLAMHVPVPSLYA